MKRIPVLAVAVSCLALASLSQAEITQHGNLRVDFGGQISPTKLPRKDAAPVKVAVSIQISPVDAAKEPPQLRTIKIAINRYGTLDATGLPVCEVSDIQPSTTEKALQACRRSLVGNGTFSAKVFSSDEAPFPSVGEASAFYGTYKGKPAILVHVYGNEPVPTSLILPFVIGHSKGTYGTTLSAVMPQVGQGNAYVTGLTLSLFRRYSYHGEQRSFAMASCPAPKGTSVAPFPFAKASFGFKGRTLNPPPLSRACRARG